MMNKDDKMKDLKWYMEKNRHLETSIRKEKLLDLSLKVSRLDQFSVTTGHGL